MKYIKTYESYSRSMINEEFVGKLVKGSLGKLFQAFSAPFKNLQDDIKGKFKEGDPNSIKGIVINSLNKAIDASQKALNDNNIANVSDVIGIMEQFKSNLMQLANGIGKDFGAAIGDKGKSSAAAEVAKAILVGSKEAEWKGIYGLLADPNYKFGSNKYTEYINTSIKNKPEDQQLKVAKNTCSKFFDNFQKDMLSQLDKELTEDEMKRIYDESIKKGGGQITKMGYEQLKELFDKKIKVIYKRDGYDDSKKLEEQKDRVAIKAMDSIDDQGNVGFKSDDGESFKKKYEDIIGPAPKEEEEIAGELKKELGKVKNDKEKLDSIKDYTKFIQGATKDKLAEVERLIKPEKTEQNGQKENQ